MAPIHSSSDSQARLDLVHRRKAPLPNKALDIALNISVPCCFKKCSTVPTRPVVPTCPDLLPPPEANRVLGSPRAITTRLEREPFPKPAECCSLDANSSRHSTGQSQPPP